MATFEVFLYWDELSYWLSDHGVSRGDMEDILPQYESHIFVSAHGLKCLAEKCYSAMSRTALDSFVLSYGDADREQMIIHIADEILDYCGRTVLEF